MQITKRTKPSKEISEQSRYMTMTYVVSLSIVAILSIVIHIILNHVIKEQSKTGNLVNMSGQQRMLSQRTAMLTLEFIQYGKNRDYELANRALDKMLTNYSLLTHTHINAKRNGKPSPMSEAMQALYFGNVPNVESTLKTYALEVRRALESRKKNVDKPYIKKTEEQFYTMAKGPFLLLLDQVVHLYEAESLAKVDALRLAQNGVLGVIIVTILLEATLIFRPMVNRVSSYANKLQKQADQDPLTGLLNRRAFYLIANKTFSLSKRYERPMSILLIDIDHFKQVNDTYGHDVGDVAIKHISSILQSSFRSADTLCRYGGEEFLLLLPDTTIQNAEFVAQSVRVKIEQNKLNIKDKSLALTVSCGIAEFSSEFNNIDEQIKLADIGLYKAKQAGRNRVEIANG